MGYKTKIDWCDSTWNPVTGCLHGCEYCYARRIAERFSGAGKECTFLGVTKFSFPHELERRAEYRGKNEPYPFGFSPTLHRYRLDEPKRLKNPHNIFVCSMADLFGDWVPDEWIQAVFHACDAAPQHRYLFLTKNPERYACMNAYLPYHRRPPYVAEMWFGHSYTGIGDYRPLRLNAVHPTFVSIEPMLRNLSEPDMINAIATNDWMIIGAETGNRKGKIIPEKAWVQKIAGVCKEYGTPLFMKKSLKDIMGNDFKQESPWDDRI